MILSDIKALLSSIRDATEEAANTASVIGTALLETLGYAETEAKNTKADVSRLKADVTTMQEDIKKIVTGGTIDVSTIVSKADLDKAIDTAARELENKVVKQVSASIGAEGRYAEKTELTVGLNRVKSEMTQALDSTLTPYATKSYLEQTASDFAVQLEQTLIHEVLGFKFAKESYVKQTVDGVMQTVSETYAKSADMSSTYVTRTAFNQTASDIHLLVEDGQVKSDVLLNAITDENGNLKSSIKLLADSIQVGSLKSGVTIGGYTINGTMLTAQESTSTRYTETEFSPSHLQFTVHEGASVAVARYAYDGINMSAICLGEEAVTAGDKNVEITPENGLNIYRTQNGVRYVSLESKPDGSGSLANGGITWTQSGELRINYREGNEAFQFSGKAITLAGVNEAVIMGNGDVACTKNGAYHQLTSKADKDALDLLALRVANLETKVSLLEKNS